MLTNQHNATERRQGYFKESQEVVCRKAREERPYGEVGFHECLAIQVHLSRDFCHEDNIAVVVRRNANDIAWLDSFSVAEHSLASRITRFVV